MRTVHDISQEIYEVEHELDTLHMHVTSTQAELMLLIRERELAIEAKRMRFDELYPRERRTS